MHPGWRDVVGHHAWANAALLAYCRDLDEATLTATAPGTYGTITQTLQHLIDAEASYLHRLTRAWEGHPWPGDDDVNLATLSERAALLGETLTQFLAGDWDDERVTVGFSDDGDLDVRAGVLLAQTLHHANEHRAHVCSILGALGYEAPDVSAWRYADATGRMTAQGVMRAATP